MNPLGPGFMWSIASTPAPEHLLEALLVSIGVVTLAEIGDKTQLLALVLAARFRRPLPIILGILFATLANHFAAGAVGTWITEHLGTETLRWILGLSFIAMAIWMLIPDKLDENEMKQAGSRFGVFGTTLIAFFIVEIGDKTQIATVALAANYQALAAVVAGTTLGMMLANVPAVLMGHHFCERMPVKLVHGIAAAVFALLGVLVLFNVGEMF